MGLDKIWVFGEANGDAVASITLHSAGMRSSFMLTCGTFQSRYKPHTISRHLYIP